MDEKIAQTIQKLKENTLCTYCKSFSETAFDYVASCSRVQGEEVCVDVDKLSDFLNFDKYICWQQSLCMASISSEPSDIKFYAQPLCQTFVCKDFDPLPTSPPDIKNTIFKKALKKDQVLNWAYENYPKQFERYLGEVHSEGAVHGLSF